MIIDFRVRPPAGSFLSIDSFPKAGQIRSRNWGWSGELPKSAREGSMPLFLDEMAESGIAHGVVWGRRDASSAHSTPHSDVAALLREHPKTLIAGFGGIALGDGLPAALREVRAAVEDHGLAGITLEPGAAALPQMQADDRRLYPVFALCEELGAIVALTISVRMGSDISYSHPAAVDRMAGDFPDLKIVVAHACWPWVEGSCGLAFRRKNVYLLPDLFGWSCPGHLQWVEAANTYLEDRMLFGSAYPLMGVQEMVRAYSALPYRDEVRKKVMYGNAARLLGLS